MPRTVSLSSPPASLISRVRSCHQSLGGCTPLCQCTPLSPDITFIFMPGSDVGLSPLTRLRPCPINCISRQQTLQSLSSSPFPRCPLLLCDPFRVTSPFKHAVACPPVRTEPTRHITMSHTRTHSGDSQWVLKSNAIYANSRTATVAFIWPLNFSQRVIQMHIVNAPSSPPMIIKVPLI